MLYWIGRINDDDGGGSSCGSGGGGGDGASIFGIGEFEDESLLANDWEVGSGRRFLWVLFEDKIFNVTDGGDNERFFVGILERLDS